MNQIRVLIIDNYDSFTHNLALYFEELNACVSVLKNDQVTIDEIKNAAPSHIVISPGPCTPTQAGISLDAIKQFAGKVPILGVCLGHQAIGQVFGANLVRAKNIKHGKVSQIDVVSHDCLFDKVPEVFQATRYHSLILENKSLRETDLIITSLCTETGSDEIMSIRHKTMKIFGIQFHPESLMTEYGHSMLGNFLRL